MSIVLNSPLETAREGLSPGRKAAPGSESLYFYFVFAYLTQGISSQFGLMAQPTQYFFMAGAGLNAGHVSLVMAAIMLPWIVKPLYGLLSDAIPLFGYRRKSYVVAAHLLALGGLLCVALAAGLPLIVLGLLVLAFGMSAASAVLLGLAAERGKADGMTARYLSAQSFYYYLGNIAAVLAGGWLCQMLLPGSALKAAALLALLPVLVVAALSWRMLAEPAGGPAIATATQSWRSILTTVRSTRFWLVALLATCWNFTPSFGVPLYFHQSNTLNFEQGLIGQLVAWNAFGMMAGAIIYRDLIKRLPLVCGLYVVAGAWALSAFTYVWLASPVSGYIIEAFRGCCNTLEILCLYELAAACCNRRNAVSVMALLVAARQISTQLAAVSGGSLLSGVLDGHYLPLILISVTAILASLPLIPRLARTSPAASPICRV